MDTPFAELETVMFTRDTPHNGDPHWPREYAKAGEVGVIVHVHTVPSTAYIVEVFEGAETIALVTVTPEYLKRCAE